MLQTKLAIIAILTVIYLLDVSIRSYGFYCGSPWWTHFTYLFFHGNIFHLTCNAYALWFCLNELTFSRYVLIPILYAIGVAASFVYISDSTTVGVSGAIFAMLGINLARTPTGTNVLYMVIVLMAGLVVPRVAGVTHLISFILGYAVAVFARSIRRFKHDYC